MPTKKVTGKTVDDYLAAVADDDARAALSKLRKTIQAAAPKAEETIGYGVPMYKQGRVLVSFGAAKNHCSFYVMSPAVISAHAADLKGYKCSKGAVSFSPDKPLPATLVKKLVKARIAENAALDKK